MTRNPVGWFELYVQDMDRARRFYETVFEVTLQHLGSPDIEMWAFPMSPDAPGCAGALVKAPGVPSGGSTMVYFSCADCAVEGSRIVGAGGGLHRDKMSIGEHGFVVLAFDTEGNMFGLHSMQ